MSDGRIPFDTIADDDAVAMAIMAGDRPPCPEGNGAATSLMQQVYGVLALCWNETPELRPSVPLLRERLMDLLEETYAFPELAKVELSLTAAGRKSEGR